MFTYWLGLGVINLLFSLLHVTQSSSFPKPLSAREETELLQQMAQGSTAAKDKLILHNLRLVAHIAKKYYASGKEQDDLISIGTIGLIKAIDTFKQDKNIKLATYAARCIENEILMSLRADRKTAQDIYFNDPIDFDSEGNPLTLLDVISEETNMVDEIDLRIKGKSLYTLLDQVLTPRERYIIDRRYGLADNEPLTQSEIASAIGISRSYVSRIEKKALAKLRSAYERPAPKK